MLEKEKALKNKSSETLPEEKYTADRLTRIWRQYAFQAQVLAVVRVRRTAVSCNPLILAILATR
jgi:hypothetical protein